MITPYYSEDNGNIQIYCGDCLEIMPQLDKVDLVLTDPDYNAKNIGPTSRKYSQGKMGVPLKEYKRFCKKWFFLAKRLSSHIVFTPGIANTHNYSQPLWQIKWEKPASVSFSRMGGFNCWKPIFIYGKPIKRVPRDEVKVNTLNFSKGPERDHPCPKVKNLWAWLVRQFSNENDLILDNFLGSGTTLVVCKELGRRGIGIEINKEYCDITIKRLKNTQKDMFL